MRIIILYRYLLQMQNILKIIYYSIAFSCCCFIVACRNDEGEIDRITQENNEPTETIHGIEVLYNDSGYVKARGLAPVMFRYTEKQPRIEMPKGIKIYFYDNRQNETSTLTANFAKRDEASKIMEARNNVVVRNSKGDQLNTEKLIWNESTGKFSSDVFVKITTAAEVIMGDGFEANEDFTHYRILHPKGKLEIKNPDTLAGSN